MPEIEDSPSETRAPAVREGAARLPEGALLSLLAHELRTPIQSIALSVELGLRRLRGSADGVPTAWMTGRLEQIQRAARNLRGIVEMVLGAAQIEAGRLQTHPERLDLVELVGEVVERVRDDLAWAGCMLTLETGAPVVGHWDRLLLELVACNLLSNAMKYGAGKPVSVVVRATGQRATLSVCDHGPGIAAADRQRIFERFVRLPSPSVLPGAGLGLWIVDHAVRALDGSVRVDSVPGEGATFTVELPMEG
jgi:signal transduction histidine kinase